MKEKKGLNVLPVELVLHKNPAYFNTNPLFIKETSHTNVIFVHNSLNIWHLKQAINVSENHLAKYIGSKFINEYL